MAYCKFFLIIFDKLLPIQQKKQQRNYLKITFLSHKIVIIIIILFLLQ